jgi:hypothetical protein
MWMRIILIVAILAALAAGTLNVLQVRDHINTLITQRDDYHTKLDQTTATLESTKKDLAKTKTELTQTQTQLADSQAARKKAEDTAAAQTKLAADLNDKLAKATQDRDTAQAELERFKVTGQSPEQILKMVALIKQDQDTINAINEEKKVLSRSVVRLQTELRKYTGEENYVKLRADLKGKVVVVDPKWDFVVLDIGADQDVLQDGELLVSRDGKLVAKVIVRTVEKDRCIANILPGWKLGEVFEGDEVTPAHPAS